jgi:hypothetical protein
MLTNQRRKIGPHMRLGKSRPWLIAGIISGASMIVGIVIFVVGSQPTDNAASPLGLLGLGFLLMLVGSPAFASA